MVDTSVALSAKGLTKAYGHLSALNGVDFDVHRGEVFALLGPNGAGKTTTVEILEGFRDRDGGEISVLGYDPGKSQRELKNKIGIVLQSTGVDPYLTVSETIGMYSGYYSNPRPTDEVIELVGLSSKYDTKVMKLSGGQQRRLDFAVALAGDPELLFLDEPTTGFDPAARRDAWDVVKQLTALGKTIFLTTHYMDEAQYLADRVAVIASGRIVAEGAPTTLAGRDTAKARVRYCVPESASPPSDLFGERTSDGFNEVLTAEPTLTLHRLTSWAIDNGLELTGLEILRPSLEDAYLRLLDNSESLADGGNKVQTRWDGRHP